jgi:ParB family transcriptional regulator, chromosome partitioning protein
MTSVPLSGIAVPPHRMRVLRPELVAELVASISAQGLLQPIVMRPRASAGYYLVAGRHRLEAMRKLGRDTIEAKIVKDLDAEEAQLAEIDENLIRGDLGPSERAVHHAVRKALYERTFPQTKRGGGSWPGWRRQAKARELSK